MQINLNPVIHKDQSSNSVLPIVPLSEPQKSRDGDSYTPSLPGTLERVGTYKKPPSPIAVRDEEVKKATDVQIGGNHYKKFKIQPVEFCILNGIGFGEGNVIKYVCRHKFKNGLEDLKKARHYIDLLIQLEYGDENQRLQAQQEMRNLHQKDDQSRNLGDQ